MRRSSNEPRDHASLVRLIEAAGVSPRVIQAFREVDRGDFVPAGTREAYTDRPIEILERQTTSQPSLIAHMIDAADLLPGDRVLEVGTGFGYQTALLAKLTGDVVSIERHPSITESARSNLERAQIGGVELVVGDGWKGVPGKAPYEAIIVSASADGLPQALADQLVEGGRLVIPLKSRGGDEVWLCIRRGERLVKAKMLTPARFVPLVQGEVSQSNE